LAPRKQPRKPADDELDAEELDAELSRAISDLVTDLYRLYDLREDPGKIERLLKKIDKLLNKRVNKITVDFEVDFRVKSLVAAILKGRLLYIGPNVSNSRIILITLCVLGVLSTVFFGIFLLLHFDGIVNR
jgi:hypothetical protein